MTLFKNKLLPILPALLMVVTMLPMTAQAAELPEETITVCNDDHCTHDHAEETPVEESYAQISIESSSVVEEITEAKTLKAPTPAGTPVATEKTPEMLEVDELPTAETPVPENTKPIEAVHENHSYSYENWEYYDSSFHRRIESCTLCGEENRSEENHSICTRYLPYSSDQHSGGSYCSVCEAYIGSLSYANHDFSYGDWTNQSASQHWQTVDCTTCGYSATQTANHLLTNGAWVSISKTQHQRTDTCVCGYSTTEASAHTDGDNDGLCGDCGYEMTRFSVTVPVSLSLTVSEHGSVYAADNAAIVNNSTGAVAITGVTVSTANGWTIVPYRSNMAAAKVDAKHIGFSMNSAQSATTGNSENLPLSGAWSIAKGATLPLSYDAVVSAMSQPVNEQVLTVVFVLDWAA